MLTVITKNQGFLFHDWENKHGNLTIVYVLVDMKRTSTDKFKKLIWE